MSGPVAFQGSAGAFGEEALRQHFGEAREAVGLPSFGEVFAAVARGDAQAGVVPIENSLHGSVLENYDLLLEHELSITAEIDLAVRHCLLARPGTGLGDVRIARSHPQALAQAAPFLREHRIEPQAAYNTAGAAREVAASAEPGLAAIAGERAAQLYGLDVVARDIQRRPDNHTRFFVIEREACTAADSNKATLAFTTANVPGALHRTLGRFADMLVNLTRLESRPTRDTAWEYWFYADCERADRRPLTEPFVEGLVQRLREVAERVRVLGVYPAATGR